MSVTVLGDVAGLVRMTGVGQVALAVVLWITGFSLLVAVGAVMIVGVGMGGGGGWSWW